MEHIIVVTRLGALGRFQVVKALGTELQELNVFASLMPGELGGDSEENCLRIHFATNTRGGDLAKG